MGRRRSRSARNAFWRRYAYPKGRGVWRDDEQGGKLLFDEPVVIQCYTTTEEAIQRQAKPLREFLVRMGTECRQGAVGFVIDREYLAIRFALNRQ